VLGPRGPSAVAPMRKLKLPNGLCLLQINESETEFVYREIFIDRCYYQDGQDLRPGDVVFDVGANIGLASLFFFLEQPRVAIFAFEPAPLPCEALRVNLRAHGVTAKVYPCALAADAGRRAFTYYPQNTVMSGLCADPARDLSLTAAYLENSGARLDDARYLAERKFETRQYECAANTVSGVISTEDIEEIALMKIDVEGSELDVLRGIRDADWSRIRQLVIEVHQSAILSEITQLLGLNGFSVAVRQDALLRNTEVFTLVGLRSPARTASTRATEPTESRCDAAKRFEETRSKSSALEGAEDGSDGRSPGVAGGTAERP